MQIIRDQKKSAAELISRELIEKGISQNDFSTQNIRHIYESLGSNHNSANFDPINDLFSSESKTIVFNDWPILGVIVETRKHPQLEFVVNNLIQNIDIPIQIFHGKDNLEFIMSSNISDHIRDGKVYLTQLDTDEFTLSMYNGLLLSKVFWEHVISRKKILIFQTDSICCSESDYDIEDFMSWDYIGSKWSRDRPIGLTIDGGNGGLSLRDWQMTYDSLVRFSPELWRGGEDSFFAFHIELIGGKVAKNNDCAKFSTQHEFLYKSWGAHDIACLQCNERTDFLVYCEDARLIIKGSRFIKIKRAFQFLRSVFRSW
jgi:hypothetical protein